MKLCETCRYGRMYELDKPCVVYRDDCPLYQKVGDGMTDDLISREAVLDVLEKEGHKWGNDYRDWVDAIEEIKKLPPVNPQEPKTGHWIRMKAYEKWECSECSTVFRFTFKEHNYCPNCGARMESEDDNT